MISKVLIFGDSITWGADDTELLGWANRLRKFLQLQDEESGVYNCGIRGDTTKGLLARFEVEANARKSYTQAIAIVFAIGINDARIIDGQPQTDLFEFTENIEKLIEKAKVIADCVAFIGLTNVTDGKATWTDQRGTLVYTSQRVREYDQAIQQIAEKNKLPYLKMFDVLVDTDMPDDGLHPDAHGHEKMFNRIKDFLKPYLLT